MYLSAYNEMLAFLLKLEGVELNSCFKYVSAFPKL